MSDTTKLILWIVLALVVILIVILAIRSASRRRKEEARRREATSLRAQARAAAERARGHEAEASRRSEKAAELAEEAKAEETAAAAEHARRATLAQRADRIDPDVTEPPQGRGVEPQGARRQGPPARGPRAADAQRGTPDGPALGVQSQSPRPPAPEPRLGQAGAARPGAARPGAAQSGGEPRGARGAVPALGLGLGAPDFDDDEPDLADSPNPFGPAASDEVGSSGAAGGRGHVLFDATPAAGRDDAVRAVVRDDVVRDADAGAGDTRGPAPDQHVLETPEVSSGGVTPQPTSESTEQGASDATDHDSTSEADDPDRHTDPDWVNGPVDEAVPFEEAPNDDDVVDWINGPDEAEPVTVELPERSAPEPGRSTPEDDRPASPAGQPTPVSDLGASDPAAPSGPTDQVLAHLPEQPHAAPVEDEEADAENNDAENNTDDVVDERDLGGDQRADEAGPGDHSAEHHGAEHHVDYDDHDDHDDEVAGQGNPIHETAGRGQRLVSRLDEVVDGGYGVGSAAPIADGAQPLGHPIKAWRDTMTYVLPGGRGYDDGEPDVWFHSEQAAQTAGYRRGGA